MRDNAGRITQKVENIATDTVTWDYTYDLMGRLETVYKDSIMAEAYSYDGQGNRLEETNVLRGVSRTYTHDDEDKIVWAGLDAYMYDVDGFLTSRSIASGANSGITAFDYSSRGELLSATLPDSTVISYDHDAMGRRVAKRINGAITEKYLWQSATILLAVYDGSDNLLQRFEYSDGRMPVAMTTGGQVYYLAYDQVGSLKVVTDVAGVIVKQIDYDSFGNIMSDSNPTFSVPFGFAGGLHDRDAGLVRFGARDYDPATGKWTAKDPIDFAGGDLNLFSYTVQDPVNWVDPLGLAPLVGYENGFANWTNATFYAGLHGAAFTGGWPWNPSGGSITGGAGTIIYSDETGFLGGNYATHGGLANPCDDIETAFGPGGVGAGPVIGFFSGGYGNFSGPTLNLTFDLFFLGITYSESATGWGLSMGFGGKGIGLGYYIDQSMTQTYDFSKIGITTMDGK